MKKQTFIEFLQDKFIEEEPMVSKDQFKDMFDGWLSNLDNEQLMNLADRYGNKMYARGIENREPSLVDDLKEKLAIDPMSMLGK